jgi:hypothetical protein
MENKLNVKLIDKFLDNKKDTQDEEKEIIIAKDGLIERFEKVYITQTGKQLLKEIHR